MWVDLGLVLRCSAPSSIIRVSITRVSVLRTFPNSWWVCPWHLWPCPFWTRDGGRLTSTCLPWSVVLPWAVQATERIQGLPPWQESPVWLGLLRRVDARRKTGAHAWLQDWPGLLSDECIRGRSWPLLGPARLQPLRWRRPPSVWSRPGTPRMAITCTPAVYCIQLLTRPRQVPRTTT